MEDGGIIQIHELDWISFLVKTTSYVNFSKRTIERLLQGQGQANEIANELDNEIANEIANKIANEKANEISNELAHSC